MLRISSRVTLCSFSKFSLPQALLKPNSICSLGAEACSYASIAARKERRKLPSAALPQVKDKDIPVCVMVQIWVLLQKLLLCKRENIKAWDITRLSFLSLF